MRLVAGVDVGSRRTKAVVVPAGPGRGMPAIPGRSSVPTRFDLAEAAERALAAALETAGAQRDEVAYLVATGYGRYLARDRDIQVTEITCHARGAAALVPGVRTILDVGAQNARAIRLEPTGRVVSFRMNDKCASGAGRFIERVAGALEVELERVGSLGLQADKPCPISSICAVLAESEVINHVTNGESIPNILQGTHESISERLASLVKQVGLEAPFGITGGVAGNDGLVLALRQRLGVDVAVPALAEHAGALGAALLGRGRLARLQETQVA